MATSEHSAGDQQLLKGLQEGKPDVVDDLLAAIKRWILSNYPRLHSEVDSLAVDTLEEAWRSSHTFRGDSRFQTWLLTIAKRVVWAKLKQPNHCQIQVVTTSDEGAVDPATAAYYRLCMDEALATLSELECACLLLKQQGLRHREIAQRLGKNENETRLAVFRAARKINKHREDESW